MLCRKISAVCLFVCLIPPLLPRKIYGVSLFVSCSIEKLFYKGCLLHQKIVEVFSFIFLFYLCYLKKSGFVSDINIHKC